MALSPSAEKPTAAEQMLESELTSLFEELAEIFGNPRSLGAIYGLLFSSQVPLSMEEIVSRLKISKGSASQGLRQLEKLGAISRARTEGERTHTYEAGLELKPLLSGFLSNRLVPRLTAGKERLKRLEAILPELPEEMQATAALRLGRISKWHRRAANLLPLIQQLLRRT